MYISIGKVSKMLGIAISTLRRWDDNALLSSSYRTPGGHRRYETSSVLEMSGIIPTSAKPNDPNGHNSSTNSVGLGNAVGYARVSGHKQKSDLEGQIQKIQHYAELHNYQITKIYSDIGSGINDNRKNFIKLLATIPVLRPKALLITYRDRLSRYGINVIQLFCDLFGCKLITIHQDRQKEAQLELVEGVIEVITSYAGRIHRQRRGTGVPLHRN